MINYVNVCKIVLVLQAHVFVTLKNRSGLQPHMTFWVSEKPMGRYDIDEKK
jgi:hypothetical protein